VDLRADLFFFVSQPVHGKIPKCVCAVLVCSQKIFDPNFVVGGLDTPGLLSSRKSSVHSGSVCIVWTLILCPSSFPVDKEARLPIQTLG